MTTKVLSAAALCLIAAACADSIPVQPSSAGLTSFSSSAAAKATTSTQVTEVNSSIAGIAAQLGLETGSHSVVTAEIQYDMAAAAKESSPTLIIANDRIRGTGIEWVAGDPRRGGRVGVNWSIVGFGGLPWIYDPGVPGSVRAATVAEVLNPITQGMSDWRTQSCMSAPVQQVSGTNADIIHGLWMPASFFTANWGPAGNSILGVTLSSVFIDGPGGPFTDIDGNGKLDYAQAIIVYNAGKLWSNNGPLGTIDLYSVITHEAGHAFGLNHFGKVFVTKKDQQVDENGNPFIFVEDIKYAPKALMNAVYVMGRGEIAGTDHSSFCQIWGSVN